MNEFISPVQRDNFNKYLSLAFVFHIALVGIGFLLSLMMGLEFLKAPKTSSKKINIIKSSVRVDIVSMPKLTVKELKKMKIEPSKPETLGDKLKEESKADIIKPDDIVIKKAKKKINLKNLLSNLSKKEKIKKVKKKKGSKKGTLTRDQREQLKKLSLEGNKISAGNNTVGDSTVNSDSEFNNYLNSLSSYVKPHWKLPSYLIEQNLKCRIRIYIASNGKILRSQIHESSGVDEFDNKALQAVKSIKSLPKPSSEILSRVVAGEVLLGFPL